MRRIGRGGVPTIGRGAIALLLVAAVAAVAVGCSRSGGVLVETPLRSADADPIRIVTVTTRAPTPEPGRLFGWERGSHLAWREIVVSVPPDGVRRAGTIQWPSATPADPAKSFATLAVRPYDPDRRRSADRGGRRILVYVHGFRIDFDTAVLRLAQFVHDGRPAFEPVLFSWPSRGTTMGYYYDRESMDGSRDALEATLRRFAADPSVAEVAILAHSMGAWIVMDTLRTMAVEPGGVPSRITDVVLASPDLDVQVFGRQLDRIGRRPAVTVVVSRDDRTLAFSSLVAGTPARLGAVDPTAEPQRTIFAEHGVTVIDATELHTLGHSNHFKFADGPELARLIGSSFADPGAAAGPPAAAPDRPSSLVVGCPAGAARRVVAASDRAVGACRTADRGPGEL